MGTAGLWIGLNEVIEREALDDTVLSEGASGVALTREGARGDGLAIAAHRSGDGEVDGTSCWIEVAMDQRDIGLPDQVLFEEALESKEGLLGLGENEETRSIGIQAMHNASSEGFRRGRCGRVCLGDRCGGREGIFFGGGVWGWQRRCRRIPMW